MTIANTGAGDELPAGARQGARNGVRLDAVVTRRLIWIFTLGLGLGVFAIVVLSWFTPSPWDYVLATVAVIVWLAGLVLLGRRYGSRLM